MTAYDNGVTGPGENTEVLPVQQPTKPGHESRRQRKSSLDVPRIKFWSWLGLESVLWGVLIAHLAHWAGNFGYFASWQARYGVGYGPTMFIHSNKDFWDRLPTHVQNGLPSIIAVLVGLIVAGAVIAYAWQHTSREHPFWRLAAVLLALATGVGAGFGVSYALADWHVHWLVSQAAPLWWVTVRHLIRDVGITLVATIATLLLFAKPKYPASDRVSVRRYVLTIPMALGAAAVPIAAIGILAWQLPWLMHHGWAIPASFGVLATEVNGWIVAGTWIAAIMGIAGGFAAKRPVQRIADDIQWFFAERSAGVIRGTDGLSQFRTRVIGTPAHRRRVHWMLDNQPDLPKRNPWIVRGMLALGFITLMAAAAGAWLTLVGPAAVH